jgi:hypothetical protein
MAGSAAAALLAAGWALARRLRTPAVAASPVKRGGREDWRVPPLALLRRPVMSTGRKISMAALRLYLCAAMILVVVRVAQLALGR